MIRRVAPAVFPFFVSAAVGRRASTSLARTRGGTGPGGSPRARPDNKDKQKKLGAFIQDKMAQWFMEAGAIAVERGPPGTMSPRPTPMAARAWATTAKPTWSTASASLPVVRACARHGVLHNFAS